MKLEKPCPIGLECLADKCPNEHYCESRAAPWPLPYQIWEIDYWYDKGALIVSIPLPTNWDEVPNNEWDIQAADAWDTWIRYIRRELEEVGWANPDELPYYWDAIEKTLIVTSAHLLNDAWNEQEGFAPAVKLDNWRSEWKSTRGEYYSPLRDELGFYLPNGVPGLAWAWEESEDD